MIDTQIKNGSKFWYKINLWSICTTNTDAQVDSYLFSKEK